MNDAQKLDNAICCATRIYHQHYARAAAVFLAGSFVRHEATESSDLDLVVIFDSLDSAFRESRVFEDLPVEVFVHDMETLRYFFYEFDRERAVPSLANMVNEGIEVTDNTNCARIAKDLARTLLREGPQKWSLEDIDKSRYAITDALNDLRTPGSQAEMIGSASVLYTAIANHYLRRNGHWSARGKSINRELHRLAPEFAKLFEHAFNQLLFKADCRDLIRLVEQLLERDGGLLFEGYRVDAPRHWRITDRGHISRDSNASIDRD